MNFSNKDTKLFSKHIWDYRIVMHLRISILLGLLLNSKPIIIIAIAVLNLKTTVRI